MKDFTKYFEENELRPTTINWEGLIKSIKDGYEAFRGLVHGIQKDAIQNGWDAKVNNKGKSWEFTFELIETNNGTYFVMTDKGTCGLTGRVLKEDEMSEDLPEEERWARFESLAFTKGPSTALLGARGRGKFIFVAASKEKTIIYDSLRVNGSYRFGLRTVKPTKSPVVHKDGEDAKRKLEEITSGTFKPLKEAGTRVIIVEPVKELVDAVKSGEFLRNIEETWWEIILKHGAIIKVKVNDRESKAEVPFDFLLTEKNEDEYKVWIKENEKVPGTNLKIKRIHIVCSPEKIKSDVQGIALQRGGMKITSLYPEYMPPYLTERIYGYITFTPELELQMREAENPEHYSFDFRRVVPNAVRRYVTSELNKFAKESLGWGVDIREVKRQLQRNAEERALRSVNSIAKFLGISVGPGKGTKQGGGGGEWKKIRVSISDLEFPRNKARINYGENLKKISGQIINDSKIKTRLKVKMFIRGGSEIKKMFTDEDILLESNSKKEIGPFNETFLKNDYPKGKYSVTMKLVALDGKERGNELDKKSKGFFVEEDPPEKGIFEKCEGVTYPPELNKIMGEAVDGEMGGFKFQYNLEHQAYRVIEDKEDELADYLFRLMAYEVCRIDIAQENSKLFKKEEKTDNDIMLKRILQVLGDFMQRYYEMG
jgi:hypothetical protein